MASPADRFTRLEKVAIFLIALGEERTREILADVDLHTVEQLNDAIRSLGRVTAEEKASVMLEFASFFYEDKPIQGKSLQVRRRPGARASGSSAATGGAAKSGTDRSRKGPRKPEPPEPQGGPVPHLHMSEPPQADTASPAGPGPNQSPEQGAAQGQSEEEEAILRTLEKLRQRLDPGKIDWGRAGYDFGEGFKGPAESDRP